MDVLNEKIKDIKAEKALKVRPENIKNGVTMFGIEGTYVGSTNNAKMSGEQITGTEIFLKTCVTEVDTIVLSSTITQLANLFNGCTFLRKAPTINTSKIVSMNYVFLGCVALTDVPVYDTSRTQAMSDMFLNCSSLTTQSLSNILVMCANSVLAQASNKKLRYIGLSSEQATICTSLPEWTACQAAGWTTGY